MLKIMLVFYIVYTSNNYETAEVFNSFFQSTFTHENPDQIPAFPARCDVRLSDIIITDDMVMEKLSKLKPFKALGPDGIHPYIIKECIAVFVGPCMHVYVV